MKNKQDTHIEIEDDIVFEDENTSASLVMKKQRDKLKECQKQKEEYLDGWQRDKADFINARKKDEQRFDEFKKIAESSLLLDLLPALDAFENAFKEESWKTVDKAWQSGINFLYNQLVGVLKDHKLEEIETLGKEFNPEEHEAIEEVEVDDKQYDGIVLESPRKGYSINHKIIRPAQVKVGKYKDNK